MNNLALPRLRPVDLADKYTRSADRVYMTGTQALVRLLMLQRQRDRAADLKTAGFVSGYRGSPLAALDLELWKAKKYLQECDVRFQPGLNEDLAATAVWGTQQVGTVPGAKVDGVFGMWYGKGPGVDRSMDAIKHANYAGTAKHGGVIALCGDDHAAKSSSLPHQSDFALVAAGMPILFPGNGQEILDLGIHAWALSRYSGLWVGLKCISDVVESGSSVIADAHRVTVQTPEDFAMPAGGLAIRWPDTQLGQESRLVDFKLQAACAYARANGLNSTVTHPNQPRLGLIGSGKAYFDMLQALSDLGLSLSDCEELGVRVHKVAMVWPLEPSTTREFARDLSEIVVVEEKRALIEPALKELLYSWPDSARPRIVGKIVSHGHLEMCDLLPERSELSPALIAPVLAQSLLRLELPADKRNGIEECLRAIKGNLARTSMIRAPEARLAYYCSGCPHNTSTHIPEGSRALAGIGCHSMAMWMPERRTGAFSHMGGEGVHWIGQAPYTSEPHVFANMGDGTYFHSGTLAIRAAVAANVNITYKLLVNDAVAMTGGQPVDGTLTVPQIVRQLQAERVRRIVVVSDDIEKYKLSAPEMLPEGTEVRHRDGLDSLQRELRAVPGCTVIVYDQTCAAEKRRRRKKILDGKPLMDDPPKRLFINEAVCEGCGDCSVQSSCLSIEPLETAFGRKRAINQSTCNKDYSCVKGFCPSFVTIKGGKLRKAAPAAGLGEAPQVPEPVLPPIDGIYNLLIAGIGGTGVVTIGQLLGMAAHLESRPISTMDITGVSQKGGAVTSHVKIGSADTQMTAARIALGSADAIIGCDIIVSASEEVLGKASVNRTRAVVNSTLVPTASFITQRDWTYPVKTSEGAVQSAVRSDGSYFVDAGALTLRLLGDTIYANPFMLGFAWQQGLIPLSKNGLYRAIELNGVAVEQNHRAFEWGRFAAHDPAALSGLLAAVAAAPAKRQLSLPELINHRADQLSEYGNAGYADRYRALVGRAESAEAQLGSGRLLSEAVAKNYAKLLAYKDEYEVARLYTAPAFQKRLADTFEGPYELEFNLAPPLLSKRNERGELVKRPFGAWMQFAFRVLTRFRFLRGTPFDPFGYTAERKSERQLIARYEAILDEVLRSLGAHNQAVAVELASAPDQVRGFGHVKALSIEKAQRRWDELLEMFRREDADAALVAEMAQRVQANVFRMF